MKQPFALFNLLDLVRPVLGCFAFDLFGLFDRRLAHRPMGFCYGLSLRRAWQPSPLSRRQGAGLLTGERSTAGSTDQSRDTIARSPPSWEKTRLHTAVTTAYDLTAMGATLCHLSPYPVQAVLGPLQTRI